MKETKFKQTEVGMIPSDWEVKTFCELFDVLPNNTLSRAELNKEYGSYKNVHYGDILVEFGEWIDCSNVGLPFINSNAKFNHTVLQDGDIVIADTAEDETVGKSTEITNAKKQKIVSGLHTIPIRPKIKFAPKWLGYYINSACWHDQILPFITGTKVSAISKAAVSQTKLFFPAKIEEQQRIANALSDVDTLIANLEKLIAKKKNIKQGAMQQLLTGKKRLPGFGSDERQKECHSERSAKREVEESSGYKMTELGMIPTDWEVKTFGELFDILPNNTLSRAELNEDSGSFKNVHYGDVLVKFPEWIDCSKNTLPFINSGAKFNHTALQDGDVIIADTAEDETVGKSTEIYNVGKMKIVSGLHTIPIRPKKKFASKWLGYFINSACWHDQILPFITGTKVSAISKTAIAETKFFYPAKIDEQTAIANVLSDIDTEISALETKLAKYRTLKTGMMQQLLTGKIRLV